MTNLVKRSSRRKGEDRRQQLLVAGLDLLCESGWPAVTTRAVAECAGATLGLVHYHFGGVANLHQAMAEHAAAEVFDPVVQSLGAAGDRVEVVRQALVELPQDPRLPRLAAALVEGALRDPALARVLARKLAEARGALAAALRRDHPAWPHARCDGVAQALVALLDGLVLHRLLDPSLPTAEVVTALGDVEFREVAP